MTVGISKSGDDGMMKELISLHKKFTFLKKQEAQYPPEVQTIIHQETEVLLGKHRTAMMNICNGVHHFVHNLNDRIHDEQMLKKVIDTVPQVLAAEDSNGVLPIQNAAMNEKSVSFVPALAVMGKSLECGGLLRKDSKSKLSALQTIAVAHNCRALRKGSEEKYLEVLLKLDKLKYLHKREIINIHVLRHVSNDRCSDRFRYLLNRFPKALRKMMCHPKGLPIHLAAVSEKSFKLCLELGMKYYARHLGFLFEKNSFGQTSLEIAVGCLGMTVAVNCIEECIPPRARHPILHKVVEHVPQFFNDFVLRYTYCLSEKDKSGRLPLHHALGHAPKNVSVELLLMANERALVEKDPVTNLYPFMIPWTNDMTAIYTLLRRNPMACPPHE